MFDDGFPRFWQHYPRREGKKAAQKAWEQLKPTTATQDEIIEALAWQSLTPDWQKDGGRFIPHPATYLRGERWTDERPQMLREDRHDRLQGLRDFVNGE